MSSKILCLASSVFKAKLLSADFQVEKDIALRYKSSLFDPCLSVTAHSGRSTSQPANLPLTEDDPDAMETLCKMLHFRYDFTTMRNTDDDSLTAFALICNKYDCCRAVAPFSRQILTLNRMRMPDNVIGVVTALTITTG